MKPGTETILELAAWVECYQPMESIDARIAELLGCSVRPFTSSLDAALTLLPNDAWWTVGAGKRGMAEPLYGALVFKPYTDVEIGAGEHWTSAAAAMTTAALRARVRDPS